MNKKILIVALAAAALIGLYGVNSTLKKNNNVEISGLENTVNEKSSKAEQPAKDILGNKAETIKKASVSKNTEQTTEQNGVIKKGNLYTNLSNNSIPLSAITEMADMPANTKNSINNIIKSSDEIYMMKKSKDKVLLVVNNQKNIRHGIEFIEISTHSGQHKVTTLGYLDKMKDSNNENWEYDKVNRPIKHIIYDNEGDVEYIEVWDYNEASPIKYELKDRDGKVVSVKKETINNDSNDLCIDHIIYDKDGNTKVKVSATYEGADIKRFTYYNSDKLSDSASVFGEYQDGKKVKETVYTSDLKVKNIYSSDYNEDGERTGIKVFDNQNNEIEQIVEDL